MSSLEMRRLRSNYADTHFILALNSRSGNDSGAIYLNGSSKEDPLTWIRNCGENFVGEKKNDS